MIPDFKRYDMIKYVAAQGKGGHQAKPRPFIVLNVDYNKNGEKIYRLVPLTHSSPDLGEEYKKAAKEGAFTNKNGKYIDPCPYRVWNIKLTDDVQNAINKLDPKNDKRSYLNPCQMVDVKASDLKQAKLYGNLQKHTSLTSLIAMRQSITTQQQKMNQAYVNWLNLKDQLTSSAQYNRYYQHRLIINKETFRGFALSRIQSLTPKHEDDYQPMSAIKRERKIRKAKRNIERQQKDIPNRQSPQANNGPDFS